MRHLKQNILGLLLSVSVLVGCGIPPTPTNPLPSATMLRSQTPSAPNPSVPPGSPAASPHPPSATPETTRTSTPIPSPTAPERTPTSTATPAPMTVVTEENGWVTYRNEIVGYEISAPKSYRISGEYPEVGWIGHGLLGPAVPDEEIATLLARYYGESLNIWMRETDPSGQVQPWLIGIYAYDILVKKLGAVISPGGVGDYELAEARETLTIDGQSFEVTFTVVKKNNQAVGELAVLYLEKDGVEFMFGYPNPQDNPEAYQTYRKEVWPVMRRIIESYKHLPLEK